MVPTKFWSNWINAMGNDTLAHNIPIQYMIQRVAHIYAPVCWTIIGLDNGLAPVRRQSIIWKNAWLSSIKHVRNHSKIWIKVHRYELGYVLCPVAVIGLNILYLQCPRLAGMLVVLPATSRLYMKACPTMPASLQVMMDTCGVQLYPTTTTTKDGETAKVSTLY